MAADQVSPGRDRNMPAARFGVVGRLASRRRDDPAADLVLLLQAAVVAGHGAGEQAAEDPRREAEAQRQRFADKDRSGDGGHPEADRAFSQAGKRQRFGRLPQRAAADVGRDPAAIHKHLAFAVRQQVAHGPVPLADQRRILQRTGEPGFHIGKRAVFEARRDAGSAAQGDKDGRLVKAVARPAGQGGADVVHGHDLDEDVSLGEVEGRCGELAVGLAAGAQLQGQRRDLGTAAIAVQGRPQILFFRAAIPHVRPELREIVRPRRPRVWPPGLLPLHLSDQGEIAEDDREHRKSPLDEHSQQAARRQHLPGRDLPGCQHAHASARPGRPRPAARSPRRNRGLGGQRGGSRGQGPGPAGRPPGSAPACAPGRRRG